MKYAKLIKLGGELIPVDKADYSTYDGGLICPECGEDVFLRKSHTRTNQEVSAAFCHKRAIPEVSVCELRVGRYTQQDVERMAGEARDQRRRKLQVSLWKYLKTNRYLNLNLWEKNRTEWKRYSKINHWFTSQIETLINDAVVTFISKDSQESIEKIVTNSIDELFLTKLELEVFVRYYNQFAVELFNDFRLKRSSTWRLHTKISKEVAIFLCQDINRNLIERILWSILDLELSDFGDENIHLLATWNKPHWKDDFLFVLIRKIAFIVLTVDWIEIFDCKTTPTKVLQHSTSRQKSA